MTLKEALAKEKDLDRALKRAGLTPEKLGHMPAVRETILKYSLSAQARVAYIKAALNKILIESMQAGDYDMALKAMREIMKDPETGMAGKAPLVEIKLGTPLEKLTEEVEPPWQEKSEKQKQDQ